MFLCEILIFLTTGFDLKKVNTQQVLLKIKLVKSILLSNRKRKDIQLIPTLPPQADVNWTILTAEQEEFLHTWKAKQFEWRSKKQKLSKSFQKA